MLDENGRDAEGAQVVVSIGDRHVRRDVRAGFSYLASSEPFARFGLGDATRVDNVVVTWIDGSTREFGPFEAGQIAVLRGR